MCGTLGQAANSVVGWFASIVIGSCCLLTVVTGAEVPLVRDGRSQWRVSLRPTASATENLAARELTRYIHTMSEANLQIVPETTATDGTIRIDCDDADVDGFDITVEEHLVGVHGHTPRGALYGVYHLLEGWGCRWFYPGKLGEVIPAKQDLVLPVGSSSQSASFRERSVMLGHSAFFDQFPEWLDFLARSRINNVVIYGQSLDWWRSHRSQYLPLLEERRMILEFGGHILPTLVPRTLFDEHPEYFRMNQDGVRTADYNFCPSSGAMTVLKENAARFFEELPEITYFHVWADDLMEGGWCHCPQCQDLKSQDQNMLAMNAMAEVLAGVNAQASLALLAYHDTARPANVLPAPNLFLFHAPRERCYCHALNDPGCRRNREEYVPDWLSLRDVFLQTAPRTIHEFSYYTDALLCREMQPPQIQVIPADARYFRSLNLPIHQNLMVSFRNWHSPPFSLILFARAAWNADVDGQQVLADFCRHYYGEQLKELMTDYYQHVDAACNRLFEGDHIVGPYLDMSWPPLDPEMRRRKIADVQQARDIHSRLLDQLTTALERSPEGIATDRLRRERDVCQLHDWLLQLAHCQLEGRFLGFQYLAGGVGDDEGRRALSLLTEGLLVIDKITTWVSRAPDEQQGYVAGWQSYYNSYANVFRDMTNQLEARLPAD
ncbi:MAG: DUF4838 domain-containing protein [Pirellulaceae bacterium]|nr:DUF4838 domain-containing protein [Pirellulaceae bacterium]